MKLKSLLKVINDTQVVVQTKSQWKLAEMWVTKAYQPYDTIFGDRTVDSIEQIDDKLFITLKG